MDDTFRDRLEQAFEEFPGQRRGLAKRIAVRCEVSDQAVGRWRKTGKVQRENLAPLAEELGVSIDWLLTGAGEMRRKPAEDMEVPIIGDTHKGADLRKIKHAPKKGELIVQVASTAGRCFALRVVNSPELFPRYNEGEIVVVGSDQPLQPGSDVFLQRTAGSRKEASIWRLAWENRGEAALDPVTAHPGEGRVVINEDQVQICRPVVAILPPAAISEKT